MDESKLSVDLKWSAWSADRHYWDEMSPGGWERMERAWASGERLVVETAPRREIRYGRVTLAGGRARWEFEEAWDQARDLALHLPGFEGWPRPRRDAAVARVRDWVLARPEGEVRLGLAHRLDAGAERSKEVFRELLAGRAPDDPRTPFARDMLSRLSRDPAALASFVATLEVDGTAPCAARSEGEAGAADFASLMLAIDGGEEAMLARLAEANRELDAFREALARELSGG